MATPTIPTPVVATPATPATARTPTAPLRGRKGGMTFSLKTLPEPLLLEQAVLDPTWNKFKTYFGVCVGGFAFMAWVVYLSFVWGRAGQPVSDPAAVQQQVVPPVQQNSASQQLPTDPTAGMSPEDLRLYERLVLRK